MVNQLDEGYYSADGDVIVEDNAELKDRFELLAGAVDYRTIDYRKKPVVLLMGNEQSGLPEDLAREADALARIPQVGLADSLNLAIATGVMLFEARRHLLTLDERA